MSKVEKEERTRKNTSITNEKQITFDEHDRENIQDPHGDHSLHCQSLCQKDPGRWEILSKNHTLRRLDQDELR